MGDHGRRRWGGGWGWGAQETSEDATHQDEQDQSDVTEQPEITSASVDQIQSEDQPEELMMEQADVDHDVNASWGHDVCWRARHGYSWICDGRSRVRCLNGRECPGTRQYCSKGCYGAGTCRHHRRGHHDGRRRGGHCRRRGGHGRRRWGGGWGGGDGYYHRRRGHWGAQDEHSTETQEQSMISEVPLFFP